MKTRHLCGLTALALSASLAALVTRAQTATDDNEGFRLATDPAVTNGYQVSWWGRNGYTYFLGRTESLTGTWNYFPIIEFGHDAPISYGYVTSAPMHFVRVTFLDYILADPFNADSDGDGLSNQQEFDAKTDAFKVDSDGDGMPDKWEIDHGFDPRDPADALADANGNGVSNLNEYREGTDPNRNFYQGVRPLITLVDGPDQLPRSGQFLPRPLRVRVTRPDGTPWAGAPVRFFATADEGLLAAVNTSSASLQSAITIDSDEAGYAQAWLKCP